MKQHQQNVIDELRNEGWLVCLWTPGELGDCNVSQVEDRVIELGNEVIDNLQGAE